MPDGELQVMYSPATQPGTVTVISTEDRVAAQAAQLAAEQARDAAVVAKDAAESAEATFTAPANDVVATMVTDDGPTKTVLVSTVAAPMGFPDDVTGRAGLFDPKRSVYLPAGASLRRVRAKLASVQAGFGRAKIAFLGHSEVAGYGSSVGLNSPAVALRNALASSGYPVGTGWVPMYCNIGSGTTRDSRWSYVLDSTHWLAGNAAGSGDISFHLRSVTSGVRAVFASDVPGTVVEIVTFGTSAAFTYSIDGAAPLTYTPTGASATEVVTVTGLPNATHTVVITTTTTSATYILAVGTRLAASAEVASFGFSGCFASDMAPTTPNFYNPYPVVAAYGPDLVIVQVGDANEAINGVSAETARTNLSAIIGSFQAAGRDVILCASIDSSSVSEATWAPFRTVFYDLADEYQIPLVDFKHRLGGNATATANGVMFDATHPNGGGYGDSMQAVAAALLDGARANSGQLLPRVLAADNFARPDASTPGVTEVGRYPWLATNSGALSIAANRLIIGSGTSAECDAYVDDGSSDYVAQVTLTSVAASTGMVFRSSGAADGYVFWRNVATGDYSVAKRTAANTYTNLSGTVATGAIIGDVLRVSCKGQQVACYVNGKLVYSFTDTDNTTKTRKGFWRQNVAASVSADSFSVLAA